MHLRSKILVICILAVLQGLSVLGQGRKAELHGIVSTVENGKKVPLGYAVVLLKPAGSYATTDEAGSYALRGLDPGTYNLTIQLIGYETVDTTLVLSAGSVRKDFLMKESSFRLEEVHVVAQASKAGESTASMISRQAIDHSQTSSLRDIMQLLPGVGFSNPDLSQAQTLSLRTASETAMNSLGTAVIVDGAPMSNNANMEGISSAINGIASTIAGAAGSSASAIPNSGIDVRQLSTDNIESVEVIRGIPSVQYGDLTSGAVIINSKAGAEPLTIRLKTDPKIFQTAVSKGFHLPGSTWGDLHLSGDYAHSNARTTEAYAYYQRLNLKSMWTRRFGALNSSVSLDLRFGKDTRNRNPDDERSSLATGGTNLGYRLSANGTWNINKGWLKTLRYDLSNSFTYKESYHEQDYTNAVSIYSTNMVDGTTVANEKGLHVHDTDGKELTAFQNGQDAYAIMLPYFYFSRYDFYGKEINTFGKVTLNLYRSWGKTSEKILLGADFKSDGNLGDGLIYPEGTPPQHTGNAEAGFRPRPLYEIPFVNQLGLFAESTFRTSLLSRIFNLTAGVRMDHIAGRTAVAPRINAGIELIPGVLSLRGGYGVTAKAPTTAYLYPNRAYYDQININNSEAAAASDRIVMATTYIFDTENPALEFALNHKAEIGLDIQLGEKRRLGITYYNERLDNGYTFGTSLDSWRLMPYRTWTLAGHGTDGEPLFTQALDTRRFFAYYTPLNTASEHHHGVEYELDLGRFDAIRTAFFLSGAWMHTNTSSNGLTFDQNMQGGSNIYSHVGIYEPRTWQYHHEKSVTTLRTTHNIPSIGFVVTLSTQLNLYTCNWTEIGNDTMPSRYISREDGAVHPFTAEMASDDAFRYMLDPRSESRFITSRTRSTVVFNLNVSKEFRNILTASFYVNNLFNSRPLDPSEITKGTFTELNNPMYFGFELKIKLK